MLNKALSFTSCFLGISAACLVLYFTSEEVGHAHMHVAFFKNISSEPIGYNTKIGTGGVNGAEWIFG